MTTGQVAVYRIAHPVTEMHAIADCVSFVCVCVSAAAVLACVLSRRNPRCHEMEACKRGAAGANTTAVQRASAGVGESPMYTIGMSGSAASARAYLTNPSCVQDVKRFLTAIALASGNIGAGTECTARSMSWKSLSA